MWDAGEFRPGAPVTIRGPRARVTMTCEKARVAVDLKIEALADEVAFVPRVRNLAPEPRALDVTFPRVSLHAPAGRAGDLWYFYPSMCPVWANQDRALDTAHSGYFPLQFQDVYDRARGGGLSLGTRSRSLRQRYFQLAKADGAATLGVEYRFNPPLPPGEWVEYPKAFVALHGGDWRPALESYQRWLASWCRPQRPRLEWYQRVWNFRTYWTHTLADGNPEFCFLDPKSGEYQPDKFVTKDRGIFGQVDMAHFFDWRISREFGTWGDYSHYEDIGGLEKFRGMIRRLQAQGVRVGLYLDAYLCSRKSLVGKEHGEAWALRRQDGRLGDAYSTPGDAMLNMCVLHPGWQDFLAQTCGRVARETGCDGIYLDEGMTDYGAYWCWSKEHGHPVPGTNQAGLLDLSRKVRAALPDQVAFYTEWAPPDVLIPHLDGAYQASLRFSDPQLSPGFLQIHRFVFSDFRVFPISNGGSMFDGIWEGTKYSLFSGVPLYSLAWGHDAECLPFYRRMSAVLHAHGEAFRTRTPQPYVQTERADVFCNAFPGAKETVWTLFNGRFRTVTGPILRVKHVPGARYRDVWNDKDLKPAIERGMAVLALPIGPRGVGVVAQRREGKK